MVDFPFTPYDAKPETVRNYADTLVAKATDVNGVSAKALEKKASAAEDVTGQLADQLDEPFQNIDNDAKQISLASAFAAGSLYRWATAITTFNTGVEDLNERYETKKASNFGIPPIRGLRPGHVQQQLDAHQERVDDAEAELIADLKDEWHQLDNVLDTEADAIGSELNKEPDKQSVLALFAAGHLPRKAFPLLKSIGIDPAKVKDVLSHINTLLNVSNGPGPSLAWSDLLDAIKGMDPRAASVVLGALTEDQLEELGGRISSERNNSDFYNFILAGATRDQINQLENLWSDLRPAGGEDWYDPGGLTFYQYLQRAGRDGGAYIGAAQGTFNDCWVFAKLNAIVSSDPDWPQEHVRENSNGTVSVKFYDGDGNPYWVTVTDELPGNGAYPEGPNHSNWAAYYEKAMAIDDHSPGGLVGGGGYGGLTAGFSDSADTYMTGEDSNRIEFGGLNPWADPYSEVVDAHNDGQGIVAGNWDNDGLPSGDDELETFHVYYVKDVLPNGDVLLGNPWGVPDSGENYDVVLTPDEFNDYMDDVSIVNQ